MKVPRFLVEGSVALAFLVACGRTGDREEHAVPLNATQGETRSAVEAKLGDPNRTQSPPSAELLDPSECAAGATVVAIYERQSKHVKESLLVFYDRDGIVLCDGHELGLMH